MKATVIRSSFHQGIGFSEVQENKPDGTAGPITYAVPGEFPIGTVVEISVTEVEPEKEAKSASSK